MKTEHTRRTRDLTSEQGFTLMEVMTVVLIIGILAGIAIPTYIAQRNNALDGVAKTKMIDAEMAMFVYLEDYGEFPKGSASDGSILSGIQPTITWFPSYGAGGVQSTRPFGEVQYEWSGTDGTDVVFGTRSQSGTCFYTKITSSGTYYYKNAGCQEPYNYRTSITSSTKW